MKIGRYIIFQASQENEISNLRYTKDSNNNIELSWDWPSDRDVKLALVFGEDETAQELSAEAQEQFLINALERDNHSGQAPSFKTVTRQFDKNYKDTLSNSKMKFTVFPASFGNNNDIHVFDQKRNNRSPFILRHINIPYEIREISKLFGSSKTIEIDVQPVELYGLKLEDAIYYTVSDQAKRYPADSSLLYGNAHILQQKTESIRLHVYENYIDILRLTNIREPR